MLVKLTIGEEKGRIGDGDKSENKEDRVKEGEKKETGKLRDKEEIGDVFK